MSAGEADQGEGKPEVEVVRLGGSLLLPDDASTASLDSLRGRLRGWRHRRASFRVWIVGTGAWRDRLRRIQAPLALSEEACHWAAIGLMSVAGEIASELIEGSEIVRNFAGLRRQIGERTESGDIVFDSTQFLREVEPTLSRRPLPHDWSVTSDSIAARIACAIDADALTLLKACPAPEARQPHAWSGQGLVDAFFPHAASPRRELRWVDLSGDPPTERRYLPA